MTDPVFLNDFLYLCPSTDQLKLNQSCGKKRRQIFFNMVSPDLNWSVKVLVPHLTPDTVPRYYSWHTCTRVAVNARHGREVRPWVTLRKMLTFLVHSTWKCFFLKYYRMVKNVWTIESTNRRKVKRVQKQKFLKIFKESEKLLNITNPCEIANYYLLLELAEAVKLPFGLVVRIMTSIRNNMRFDN